jgi:hypothetical protein
MIRKDAKKKNKLIQQEGKDSMNTKATKLTKDNIKNLYNKKDIEKLYADIETIDTKKTENLTTEKGAIQDGKLKKFKHYDNFELNELEYLEALLYDRRTIFQFYWSVLMREHLFIFTFIACDDYNLTTVKVTRFFFLLCTDMAMNAIFFNDESMHKIYVSGGKYDFLQNILRILYSLIISHLIEVFICFLSMTDKHIYEIKKIAEEKLDKGLVVKIIECIKRKIACFFIFTSIFFMFYWYLISAFCAVYHNTQTIFIRDSLTSFAFSLVDPFIIYIFPAILRIISLKDIIRKRLGCIYKISDLIPIF